MTNISGFWAVLRNWNPSCHLPDNTYSEHYLLTKDKIFKSSEAIKAFQCQNHDRFPIFFNMQGIWFQDTNTKVPVAMFMKTISSFKSVLGLLINLPSCFTKMQYTLWVPNKSQPFHFTAPWVKSWQPRSTINKRRVSFSSLKVRET